MKSLISPMIVVLGLFVVAAFTSDDDNVEKIKKEAYQRGFDDGIHMGYRENVFNDDGKKIDQLVWHRPGHIQTSSIVTVRSDDQDILNYGIVKDDSTSQEFFFFNINEAGEQIIIRPSDQFFFERLANAPKIRFRGSCYQLVYPIGVNLGPSDHSHPCDSMQFGHRHHTKL